MKALLEALGDLAATYGTSNLEHACREFFRREKIGHAVERRPIPKQWLQDAYAKQNGRCDRCKVAMDFREATGDHKIPLAHGGKHNRHNIACLCRPCNSKKGSKTPLRESKASGRTILEIIR